MSDYTDNENQDKIDYNYGQGGQYGQGQYGQDQYGQNGQYGGPDQAAPEGSYIPDVTVGGIFKEAFARFRANIAPIFLMLLSVSLPVALIRVLIIERNFNFGTNYSALLELLSQQTADESDVEAANALMKKIMLYYGLILLLSLVLVIFTTAMIRLVRQGEFRDNDTDRDLLKLPFGELFDSTLRVYPKVLLTAITVGISMFVGFMLCFLPGILVMYIFQFAQCAAVFTGLAGRKAGFVSSLCTRKYPRIAVITCVLYLLYSAIIPNFGVNLISAGLSAAGLSGVAFDVVNIVLILFQQLLSGFGTLCVACVFSRLYPGIEGMLKSAGLVKDKED